MPNEDDIWFTKNKDANTLYVFLTRRPDWPRGERREFLLRSVKASSGTKISVLGHGGKTVEYMPDVDPAPRFEQTSGGLKLSIVRAHRLYNNHKWHNPVVVKLENVERAFETPPYAETVGATADGNGRLTLRGRLVELAGAGEVEVGFEHQVYPGMAAAMHNTEWTATPLQAMTAAGGFEAVVSGLEPGVEYQYRAIVKHPAITMRGDHQQILAK